MNIKELTIADVEKIVKLFSGVDLLSSQSEELPFGVGDPILIRTVTMIQIGTVRNIGPNFITLEDAGWVADTGRFGECLKNGTVSEFERAPEWVLVGRGAIVDTYPWPHDVPKESK